MRCDEPCRRGAAGVGGDQPAGAGDRAAPRRRVAGRPRRDDDARGGQAARRGQGRGRSALAFAAGVDVGMVHINSQTTGGEPHIPFGGTKRSSSYSREVGRHGLEFFSQIKTIYLEGS